MKSGSLKNIRLLDRYFVNRSFYSDRVAEKLAMSSPSSLLFDNKNHLVNLSTGLFLTPVTVFIPNFPGRAVDELLDI